jgi:S-(hydroxymethyl)glutathione dehydrogenase / alcohol dehydrogenase
MKAAVLVKNREPLELWDLEMPSLEFGQVLVNIKYTTLCGAQINEIDAVKGPDKYLPHLLGHEGSGIVEAIGQGVTKVKKGDLVVVHWRPGVGVVGPTPKYCGKDDLVVNAGPCTTFSEQTIVSENRVTPIPSDSNLRTACLYGCALTSAYGMIHNDARMKAGQSVLIFGAGGLGIAAIMMAKLINANPIVAVDINEYKLGKALEAGADLTLNSRREPVEVQYLSTMKFVNLPEGADVVIDTTGIKSVREQAYKLTAKEGVCVLAGVPHKGDTMEIDSFQLHFRKRITGSEGGSCEPAKDIPRLMALERLGVFNPEMLITHEFPLERINEAFDLIRKGDCIKCLIKI